MQQRNAAGGNEKCINAAWHQSYIHSHNCNHLLHSVFVAIERSWIALLHGNLRNISDFLVESSNVESGVVSAAKLEHLEAAEFEAAEREDFELAASLGSDLDATKAQLEALQEQCKVSCQIRSALPLLQGELQ